MDKDLSDNIVRIFAGQFFPYEHAKDDNHMHGQSPGETVGTGFQISPTEILTCAHVVADALQINPKDKRGPLGDYLQIEVDVTLQHPTRKIAAVSQWYPTNHPSLPDVAVLEMTESHPTNYSRENWGSFAFGEETKMFGFGYDAAQKKYTDQSRWVVGKIMGPNKGWIEVDCGELTVLPGYSGAPVLDSTHQKVYGMIVARAKGEERRAYMLPANKLQEFSGVESGATSSVVSALSRILDRIEQSAIIENTLQEANFHCFVVPCVTADAPEYLAHKLKIVHQLRSQGLRNFSCESIEPKCIAFRGSQTNGFHKELKEELEQDIEQWIKTSTTPNIVYISSSDGRDIVDQVKSVARELQRLKKVFGHVGHNDDSHLEVQPLIVIAPFYMESFTRFGRWRALQSLRALPKSEVTLLPAMGFITVNHLEAFVEEALPKKARDEFRQRFDRDFINEDFTQLFDVPAKRYRDIGPRFAAVLQKREQKKE